MTRFCLEGIQELMMTDVEVTQAKMLTEDYHHAFMLTVGEDYLIAVKDGFSSGYGGEGPTGLSAVLHLFEIYEIPVHCYSVSKGFMERLRASNLTNGDLAEIEGRPDTPYAPYSWDVFGDGGGLHESVSPWHRARMVLPAAILDSRLYKEAARFWKDADGVLLKAYRKLEDSVRKRANIDGEGAKLFSAAFRGDDAPLQWSGISSGEREGRANLFCGAFGAYRNPHMHSERSRPQAEYLSEFMLLNELYRLERLAEPASVSEDS